MVAQFKALRVKGAAFENLTKLQFFDNNKQRIALVYGKNGSGKSTIAKGFLKTVGADVKELEEASLLDENSSVITLSEEDYKKIHIFDENYIQNNIRLKEDGLDTIVMLGQQVGIENNITEVETRIKVEKIEVDKQQEVCDKYEDQKSPLSPRYFISQMNLALSGDSNWSGRIREIDINRRRNASVNNDTYKVIISKKPTKTQADVCNEYAEKLTILRQAEAGNATINTPVKCDYRINCDEAAIITLLAEEIEKPELTKREEYLLSLINQGKSIELETTRDYFTNNEINICPYCFQTVSTDYKKELIESISRVLTKIVDEHKAKLAACKLQELVIDLSEYVLLGQDLVDDCYRASEELRDLINEINRYLQNKIDKPYNPIITKTFKLQSKVNVLNEAMKKLEEARKKYNEPFENARKVRSELETLNNERAYYEIANLYESYLEQDKKKKEEDIRLRDVKKTLMDSEKELADLVAQKKNVNIAMDIINGCLRYIFFSRDRMVIKSEGENYILESNGKRVKPSNISVGERNIIALCYYFTEMLTNQEKEKAFSEEILAIIDDPISSFDIENKVGILSFLRERMNVLLMKNVNSRVVLMTHDLPSFFDLQKVCEEMKDLSNKQTDFKLLELNNRMFNNFQYKKRHEYTELLQSVYLYAKTGDSDYELTIGNIMRRTLETYSTFIYKKGIAEISYDDEIMGTLTDDNYIRYFKNLMYRLVLNGESHMEERARTATDMDFLEIVDPIAKQKTARDIIALIYLLNPVHVKAHLGEDSDIYTNIKTWCKKIKELELSD